MPLNVRKGRKKILELIRKMLNQKMYFWNINILEAKVIHTNCKGTMEKKHTHTHTHTKQEVKIQRNGKTHQEFPKMETNSTVKNKDERQIA